MSTQQRREQLDHRPLQDQQLQQQQQQQQQQGISLSGHKSPYVDTQEPFTGSGAAGDQLPVPQVPPVPGTADIEASQQQQQQLEQSTGPSFYSRRAAAAATARWNKRPRTLVNPTGSADTAGEGPAAGTGSDSLSHGASAMGGQQKQPGAKARRRASAETARAAKAFKLQQQQQEQEQEELFSYEGLLVGEAAAAAAAAAAGVEDHQLKQSATAGVAAAQLVAPGPRAVSSSAKQHGRRSQHRAPANVSRKASQRRTSHSLTSSERGAILQAATRAFAASTAGAAAPKLSTQ